MTSDRGIVQHIQELEEAMKGEVKVSDHDHLAVLSTKLERYKHITMASNIIPVTRFEELL